MRLRTVVLASLMLALGLPAVAATFETGGVTIWYEVRGSGTGTPLVVANGGPGFDHSYPVSYTHLTLPTILRV